MGHRSPIGLSTTVPLTLTVLDSTLHGIEHQPTHHEGRKPIEKMGGVVCIDTEQAHTLGCLTLVY